MTVGTNALLEERGARTALIATRGFADLLEIGRQDRPELYRLCAPKPAPLVEPELRFEAAERIGPEGVVEPLGRGEPERLAELVRASGAESVAICLLFSYLDPSHERAIAAHLRRRAARRPRLRLARGAAALPRVRALLDDRRSTPTSPPCSAATWSGSARPQRRRACRSRSVMQSSGGVADGRGGGAGGRLERALRARRAAPSAPACSPAPAATATRSASTWAAPPATSAWSRTARCGAPTRAGSAAASIQLPMVDVHTVGAGGGSIGWRDPRRRPAGRPALGGRRARARLLRPRRHRADRHRRQPAARPPRPRTRRLAGGVALDAEAARASGRRRSPARSGSASCETAEGIVRVANQEMVRALRVVTVERGIDPRRFALLPFGGAGPMHAAAIAAELGIERILCPRAGGVLSALGLCASDRRRDTARTVMLSGAELSAERIAAEVEELVARARPRPRRAPSPRWSTRCATPARPSSCRCPGPTAPDPAELRRALRARARGALRPPRPRRRGRARRHPPGDGRARARDRGSAAAAGGRLRGGSRRVRFDGEWVETPVLRGEPPAGFARRGPGRLRAAGGDPASCRRGWRAEVDAGTIGTHPRGADGGDRSRG